MGYGGDKCPKCGSTHTAYDAWNKENICKKCGIIFQYKANKGVNSMNCFPINVFVYNLRFKKYICGNREDYTDEQIMEIREEYKNEIKDKLDALGYMSY